MPNPEVDPAEAAAVRLLLISSAVLCVSDVFIKLVTALVPPGQFMVLRGVACVALYSLVIGPERRGRAMAQLLRPRVLLRALFEAASVTCFILALQALPVATVTSLYMTAPILTITLAFLLGMSGFRWTIIAAGALAFAGIIMIAAPRGGLDQPAILMGLAAAGLVCARDLITRALPATVSSAAVALATMGGVAVAGWLLDPLAQGWHALKPLSGAAILAAAGFTALGNHLVIEAFRRGDPALMSVLRYAAIPMSLVLGWVFWRIVPGAQALAGSAMVIAAGVVAQSHRFSRRH